LPAARGVVTALALSPDERLVAVGNEDGVVQLWQRGDTDVVPSHRLTCGELEVRSIVFHPDGVYVLAGGRDGLRVWDVATGRQVLTGPYPAWGFARDGRRFGCGSTARAAFCELSPPEGLRPLSGHAASIEWTTWSGDGRTLASLDSSYVARVWDAGRGTLLNEFSAPRGAYFAANAGLALSDDGGQLAYVSGGDNSQVVLWDVRTGKKLESWSLRRGFERLVCSGGGRFLLVREEEKEEGKGSLRTAAYEFAAGKPPREVREVRPAEAGERGFFNSRLTPDGRYYWWAGPRVPQQAYRVEVLEVATGRLVTRVPYRPGRVIDDLSATLSPDGRFLWVERETADGMDRHDLSGALPRERTQRVPEVAPGRSEWLAYGLEGEESPSGAALALQRPGAEGRWLTLGNWDERGPRGLSFSGDGRHVAWGNAVGDLWMADLTALEERVSEFEKTLRAK
jgi:hypothetical protein